MKLMNRVKKEQNAENQGLETPQTRSTPRNWKPLARLLANVVAILGIAVTLSFVSRARKEAVCVGMEVKVDRTHGEFVDAEFILNTLAEHGYDAFEGRYVGEIDLNGIETLIRKNPYVLNAEATIDLRGKLQVVVHQRRPAYRVINAAGKSFYVDSAGYKMPYSPGYDARMLIVTSEPAVITEKYSEASPRLFTANALAMDTLMKALAGKPALQGFFTQVHALPQGRFELIPRIGSHVIRFGSYRDASAKFDNLLAFYTHAQKHGGWSQYEALSVEYRDQIIAQRPEGTKALEPQPAALDSADMGNGKDADIIINPALLAKQAKSAADSNTKSPTN